MSILKNKKQADYYYPKYLGPKLGQQYGLPAGIHGNSAQEAGTHPGFSPVHPDPYWCGIPDGQG